MSPSCRHPLSYLRNNRNDRNTLLKACIWAELFRLANRINTTHEGHMFLLPLRDWHSGTDETATERKPQWTPPSLRSGQLPHRSPCALALSLDGKDADKSW
jgi:hypothetical protein